MGDYRTTRGESLPPPRKVRHFRLRMGVLFFLLAASVVITAGVMIPVNRYVAAVGFVTTEDYAEVRPPLSGTVSEILIDSGRMVEAGQVLVRLDSSQEQAALGEAQAVLRKTKAETARREIEIAEKKRALAESVSVAKLRLENTDKKLKRTRELLAKGLISGSLVEDLELERDIAESELKSLAGRDLSLYDRELEALAQDIEARQDAVHLAELRVRQRDIKAPIGGQVLRYEFVIGELVRPETVLFEIFGGTRRILKLKVAERFAAKVIPGQRCTSVLTSYRGSNEIIFQGKVEHLRNVIQGDGEKNYRVAYCSFDSRGMAISPGTTAQARIYYGASNLWSWIFGME
ncbi:MAG: efflux RND transporter periplasmic adaptor subunit [Lentisphaeria bacterium]|nr:efflux RND transporter periplasmic adaptor subunit [Lentisphaeria bacterium]